MTQTKARLSARTQSPLRRRLKFEGITGGIAEGTIKSLTRDDGTKHHPRVCLETGDVFCTCEHFYFRLAKHEPTLANSDLWCKHIKRQVAALMRRGEIADKWLLLWLRPCIGCGVMDAENAIAPDGHHVTGYVCDTCESAWQRDERAGTPVELCPGCSHPENICDLLHICDEWNLEQDEIEAEVMAHVDFDNR